MTTTHTCVSLYARPGLDYPDFYTKLYATLTPHVFTVTYRPQLFRLLKLFLYSTHLPAYLVAAFIKKMARLCLGAPPAGTYQYAQSVVGAY